MSGQAVRWVFEHSPLKGAELLVHVAIADTVNESNGHEFWASLQTLADKTKVNRNTVRATVRKLEDLGCLRLVDASRGRSCKYVFETPNLASGTRPASDTQTAPQDANPASESADPAPQMAEPRATDAPNTSNATERKSTQTRDGFDEFWELWPRKLGKPAAAKAWKSAIRRANSEAIMSGLDSWTQHWAHAGTEVQFIPHASTWLNRDQWDDYVPPLPRRGGRASDADTAAALVADAVAPGFPNFRRIGASS